MSVTILTPRARAQSFDPREDRAVFRRIFDGRPGVDFSALNEATAFLTARGFSYGPPCTGVDGPKAQGVMYGHWKIAKWRNLTPQEQAELHGTITGDRRHGPVRVAIFWGAPALAIAAVAEPHLADRIVSTWATQR